MHVVAACVAAMAVSDVAAAASRCADQHVMTANPNKSRDKEFD
jgi:hypothetical protein